MKEFRCECHTVCPQSTSVICTLVLHLITSGERWHSEFCQCPQGSFFSTLILQVCDPGSTWHSKICWCSWHGSILLILALQVYSVGSRWHAKSASCPQGSFLFIKILHTYSAGFSQHNISAAWPHWGSVFTIVTWQGGHFLKQTERHGWSFRQDMRQGFLQEYFWCPGSLVWETFSQWWLQGSIALHLGKPPPLPGGERTLSSTCFNPIWKSIHVSVSSVCSWGSRLYSCSLCIRDRQSRSIWEVLNPGLLFDSQDTAPIALVIRDGKNSIVFGSMKLITKTK